MPATDLRSKSGQGATPFDLASFRRGIAATAGISTIGVSTAEGVSPRNAALERLAWNISQIDAVPEQVDALRDILRESLRLPHDQHAHVVATIVHDLVMPGRIALKPAAKAPAGELLMRAGLEVAPKLVPESLAYTVLRLHLQRLAHRAECRFGDDVYDRLDEVGFNNPALVVSSDDLANRSPLHRAQWLRNRIDDLTTGQIPPADFAALLDEAQLLPAEIKGDVLVKLVNRLWNTSRDPGNADGNRRLMAMVGELPPHIRITCLEAFFNQFTIVPHELAREWHLPVLAAVQALPGLPDSAWFNQSRSDLVSVMGAQGRALGTSGFLPMESLQERNLREGQNPAPEVARLFTQMFGRQDLD